MTGNARCFAVAVIGLVLLLALALPHAASAQSVADFYRGKSIDLDIGYSVGGGYDLYARLIARRLGGHIPGNPTVVPKNMEGAGSLRLANYLYAAAPKDGTVIGATSRGAAFDPLLGTKFKIVTGYPGGNDVSLALERGEVQGRCGWSWSSIKTTRFNWVRDKRIIVLVQMSLSKHPDLPDVPLIMDLAKTDVQRQIFKMIFARQTMGRPYLAPPGVPADRLAALRQAFMDTMTDKEFLAEAEANKFEINAVSGEDLEALVKEVYRAPAEVAKKAAAAVQ
jgi:tripartite-type tricarboxylate transporter receptor subunit TctC